MTRIRVGRWCWSGDGGCTEWRLAQVQRGSLLLQYRGSCKFIHPVRQSLWSLVRVTR